MSSVENPSNVGGEAAAVGGEKAKKPSGKDFAETIPAGTTVKNMEQLKKEWPEVYKVFLEGMAMDCVMKIKHEEEEMRKRRKQREHQSK